MPYDLRCPSKKHAVLVRPAAGGIVEFKCNSDRCGAAGGVIVLHRFDTGSGELTQTLTFKTP